MDIALIYLKIGIDGVNDTCQEILMGHHRSLGIPSRSRGVAQT
jgi:hypothetical protein